MSKRPSIDLMALTSEQAAPMQEAVQRTPAAINIINKLKESVRDESARTENLEALAFKVPSAFRMRFKKHAVNADLKLNELLFEALEAWEEKNNLKK